MPLTGSPAQASVRPRWPRAAIQALAAVLLAGCHGAPPAPPAAAHRSAAKPAGKAEAGADAAVQNAARNMAAGVPLGQSTAPVDMRFDLTTVPTPGTAFTIGLVVLPSAPVPVLRLDAGGGEGLLILAPEAVVTREKVPAGAAVPLAIRAMSPEAGTRVLTVRVTLELPDGLQARTFGFPIVVGMAKDAATTTTKPPTAPPPKAPGAKVTGAKAPAR